jgi:hypothetical protein
MNTARQDRLLKASMADLHEQLGIACQTGGNRLYAGGHTYRTDSPSPLRGVHPVDAHVNYDSIGRCAAIARERRAELGEARWNELNKEWWNG